MKSARLLPLLALVAIAAPAEAQLGGAVGFRSASNRGSESSGSRTGVELRGFYDRVITSRWGLRAELGFNQMAYRPQELTERYRVNENGFELALQARVPFDLAGSSLYALGGPMASFRSACGVDSVDDPNGRVPCGEGETALIGWGAGLGVRGQMPDPSLRWVAEARVLGRVTSGIGGTVLALSVGIQRHR
ncbi:MAG: hypothetical protein RLZZ63_155 [Gemmatimonadota bacterium]|jgi:hypothetical protein